STLDRRQTKLARLRDDATVDANIAAKDGFVVGNLFDVHLDLHLVAGLHEVPVANLLRAREAPAPTRLLLDEERGELAEAAEDEHAGKHVKPRKVAVEDRECVRHVPKPDRALPRLDAHDLVEARPTGRPRPYCDDVSIHRRPGVRARPSKRSSHRMRTR